jgi:eukaryotic-like serine/threonine-protein kinase
MPVAAVDPLVGRVVGGCRLEQRLGAGALAVVYRGSRLADGAAVAVKLLTSVAAQDEENRKRLQREGDLGRRIRHDNICAIHGDIHEGAVHGLVMELVVGISLEAVIDRRGRLPWREAVHLLVQVGDAMAYLGSLGIVHRDLKPGNILLNPGGVAKVVDLGFAKSGEVLSDDGLTMAGTAMGSPAYMPPEQVRDASAVSHAADVYGLGATLFHAVTGREPFVGRTSADVMRQVVNSMPPDPRSLAPDVAPAIAELIIWSLAKEPGHRPQDAGQFTALLRRAAQAPDDISAIRRLRRGREGLWIVIAVVAGCAVGLAGLLWWLIGR